MYDELVKRLRMRAHLFKQINQMENCIMEDAANAIEELQADKAALNGTVTNLLEQIKDLGKPRWIPVEERLPEEEESVLVMRKFLGLKGQVPPSTYVEIAYRIDDRWGADSDEYKIARSRHTEPLYWMPLPEPPKEE